MTWTQVAALWESWGPVGVLFVVLVVLIIVLRKAWPFLSRLVLVINAGVTLPEELAKLNTSVIAMGADIGHIKHELQNNDGSSLKDAIQRTEKGVAAIKKTVVAQGKKIDKVQQDQATAATLVVEKAERDGDPT